MIDRELATNLLARWGQELAINVLQTVGALLIEAGPDHDDIAVGQGGYGRVQPGVIGRGVDQHVAGEPGIADGKEAGVDVLKALLAALPYKGSATVIQQGNPRALLISSASLIDAKGRQASREAAVQAQGADSKPVTVGDIVLPNQVAAGRFEAKAGTDLVA